MEETKASAQRDLLTGIFMKNDFRAKNKSLKIMKEIIYLHEKKCWRELLVGYEDPTGKSKNRFFSKFTQNELNILSSLCFSIIEIHKIEVKKMKQSFFLVALKAL